PRAHRRGPDRRGGRDADLLPGRAAADGARLHDRAADQRGGGLEQLLPAAAHLQRQHQVPADRGPGAVVRARAEQRQRPAVPDGGDRRAGHHRPADRTVPDPAALLARWHAARQHRELVRRSLVAAISLRGLTKVYATGVTAVSDLDLEVDDGELVVLVGPSGCGKTTALRMVAGLERITSGTVSFGDR